MSHSPPIMAISPTPISPITEDNYYYNMQNQFSHALTTTSTTTTTTEPPAFNFVPSNGEFMECGLAEDVTPLVVHGKPTKSGQYPWLTAIFHLEEDGSYKFRCAGSLLSKRHIITGKLKIVCYKLLLISLFFYSAAHCVQQYKTLVVKKENLVLVLGKHNIKTWALRSTIRDVKSINVHPDFNLPGDADLAILITSQIVEYTNTLRSVCLWSGEDRLESITSSRGTVAGKEIT